MAKAFPEIVVLDDWEGALGQFIDWPAIQAKARVRVYERHLVGVELLQALQGTECMVLFRDRTPVTRELLLQLPQLKLIISTGTRNQQLDLEAAKALGITVCFTEWGPSKASTCEMTWALILSCARRLPHIQLSPTRNEWRRPDAVELLPQVLTGKTLGLIGLGQIGQRVAAVGLALGMRVMTWSPHMTAERAAACNVEAVALDDLLRRSDVLSLHLVPSKETRHLLNARSLALLKPNSILVNTSRAELIEMPALVEALHKRQLGFAGLDVFEQEPLPASHPLLALDNILLTSHYGFICREVLQSFAEGVQTHLQTWLSTPDQ